MHAYERWILRRYLANALMTKFEHKFRHQNNSFTDWLRTRRSPDLSFSFDEPEEGVIVRKNDARQDARFQRWRSGVIVAAAVPAPDPSPRQKRIDWISTACGLDDKQRFLFGLIARFTLDSDFEKLVAAVNDRGYVSDGYDHTELRPLLGMKIERRELSETGLLIRFGLIDLASNGDARLSSLTETLLTARRMTKALMRGQLMGEPASATLTWDDFAHLRTARDLAARLVASGTGAEGGAVNILLHGAPGTGKTEFVKSLGAHVGYPVHFVGEKNGKGTELQRQERVAALTLVNAIGATADKMIVAVDEADDLFAGVDEDNAATRHGSKVFMHRLVERTRAPTVWIVNDAELLGPAVVRRMNLVVRFPQPNEAVRSKMVERIAVRENFAVEERFLGRLASLSAPPALIENAIRSAARIRGSGDDALEILGAGIRAMGTNEIVSAPAPIGFDPSLSRADIDLVDLTKRIRNAPSRALSFCLSGPPGTGKSAYARHLAAELGLEAIEKRYSDLVSCYVGDSEKAIAAAFAEAADSAAFLILDEADSLLRDRASARHSWEITQVNEMLTWMERHPLPFACTTNAPELMDPATIRRFLFKVNFQSMDAGQVAAAFRKAFRSDAPKSILTLETLTPGDFAVVARKAEALGEHDPRHLARWLEEEAAAKPEGKKVRMGF
jgi:transitional endoplasmic reticulum ATPase